MYVYLYDLFKVPGLECSRAECKSAKLWSGIVKKKKKREGGGIGVPLHNSCNDLSFFLRHCLRMNVSLTFLIIYLKIILPVDHIFYSGCWSFNKGNKDVFEMSYCTENLLNLPMNLFAGLYVYLLASLAWRWSVTNSELHLGLF